MHWILIFLLHGADDWRMVSEHRTVAECQFAASVFIARYRYHADIADVRCLKPDGVPANMG